MNEKRIQSEKILTFSHQPNINEKPNYNLITNFLTYYLISHYKFFIIIFCLFCNLGKYVKIIFFFSFELLVFNYINSNVTNFGILECEKYIKPLFFQIIAII